MLLPTMPTFGLMNMTPDASVVTGNAVIGGQDSTP